MTNVLWFAADALRYDYARKLDGLQEWARAGVACEQHFSVAHCSDPNFMSLLTGNYPETHGIMTQMGKDYQYGKYPGIQVFLRKFYGHRCMLFGPNKPLFYMYGYDVCTPAGRKDWTESLTSVKEFMMETAAAKRPWFVMLRTMDCHAPYYGGAYRRATRYTDELLGDLLEFVGREFPDTFTAVFSDHGESLGEHGMRGHFSTLYDTLVHTPMYMKWPACPQGMHVDAFTQHVDLAPTTAAVLGCKEPYWGGANLLPLFEGNVKEVHSEMYFVGDGAWREEFWSWRAVRDKRFKYMVSTHIEKGAQFWLYDVVNDPREQDNLIDKPACADVARAYAGKLCAHFPGWPNPFTGDVYKSPYTADETAVIMNRLRGLGYA